MICVKVPATSANCCVGFDTLGMALDWFATFYFEPNPEFVIEGCPDEFKNEVVILRRKRRMGLL